VAFTPSKAKDTTVYRCAVTVIRRHCPLEVTDCPAGSDGLCAILGPPHPYVCQSVLFEAAHRLPRGRAASVLLCTHSSAGTQRADDPRDPPPHRLEICVRAGRREQLDRLPNLHEPADVARIESRQPLEVEQSAEGVPGHRAERGKQSEWAASRYRVPQRCGAQLLVHGNVGRRSGHALKERVDLLAKLASVVRVHAVAQHGPRGGRGLHLTLMHRINCQESTREQASHP
jgi:hypothetical protein